MRFLEIFCVTLIVVLLWFAIELARYELRTTRQVSVPGVASGEIGAGPELIGEMK